MIHHESRKEVDHGRRIGSRADIRRVLDSCYQQMPELSPEGFSRGYPFRSAPATGRAAGCHSLLSKARRMAPRSAGESLATSLASRSRSNPRSRASAEGVDVGGVPDSVPIVVGGFSEVPA